MPQPEVGALLGVQTQAVWGDEQLPKQCLEAGPRSQARSCNVQHLPVAGPLLQMSCRNGLASTASWWFPT